MALAAPDGLQAGLVVAAHGRHVVVETPEAQRVHCVPRGKKTDLVVGDRVAWQASGDGGVIERIEPRRNLLFRQDDWRSKSFAANLDQLLVLLAAEPRFSEMQLARSLIAATAAGIPTLIGLNKTDLAAADEARARLVPYRAMGVTLLEFSLKGEPQAASELLAPWLRGRTTLILGPSGMGKSTLINRFIPQAQAQVGEISQALQSGRHTTTTTTWYWLGERGDAGAGALIDSPGFQEFGLRQVAATDLAALMPDLAAHLGQCRFANCSHRHEPGCGVRAAAALGVIHSQRMRLYELLHEELSAPAPR